MKKILTGWTPVIIALAIVFVAIFAFEKVRASSSVWDEALIAQRSQVETMMSSWRQYGESGAQLDFQLIEGTITVGIEQLEAITVEPCFQTWWAYARSSWAMAAQGHLLLRVGQPVEAGHVLYAAGTLIAMADKEAEKVVCTDGDIPT